MPQSRVARNVRPTTFHGLSVGVVWADACLDLRESDVEQRRRREHGQGKEERDAPAERVRDDAGRHLEEHHPRREGGVRDEHLEERQAGAEQEERVDTPDQRRRQGVEPGQREVPGEDPSLRRGGLRDGDGMTLRARQTAAPVRRWDRGGAAARRPLHREVHGERDEPPGRDTAEDGAAPGRPHHHHEELLLPRVGREAAQPAHLEGRPPVGAGCLRPG